MAKKKTGFGRATPKGTKNPEKKAKVERPGLPEKEDVDARQTELPGKARSGNQRAARPVSHNRGNR